MCKQKSGRKCTTFVKQFCYRKVKYVLFKAIFILSKDKIKDKNRFLNINKKLSISKKILTFAFLKIYYDAKPIKYCKTTL